MGLLRRLRAAIRTLRARALSLRYRNMSAREIFSQVYAKGHWGFESTTGFNSGSGSGSRLSSAYVDLVRRYILNHGASTVVDLGCGDFRVGAQICEGLEISYVGVDVVPSLVDFLNEKHSRRGVEFVCLDIIEDHLPVGDLYLVRQVFQHLSNAQIQKILGKLSGATLLVTEHVPAIPKVFNKDKEAGPDIRLYVGSGVFLEHPPFSLDAKILLEVPAPLNEIDAVLRTCLLSKA